MISTLSCVSFAQNSYTLVGESFFQQSNSSEESVKTRDIKTFKRIKKSMNMKQIKKLCGEPDEDIGSGIHIYVYKLDDNSLVRIGTPDDKKIAFVEQVFANGKINRFV